MKKLSRAKISFYLFSLGIVIVLSSFILIDVISLRTYISLIVTGGAIAILSEIYLADKECKEDGSLVTKILLFVRRFIVVLLAILAWIAPLKEMVIILSILILALSIIITAILD